MRFSEIAGNTGIFVDGDWIEKKDQDASGAVRLIQLADIGPGDFRDKSDKHITVEKAAEFHCTFLQKGDILIARLGEPLCKACIFPLDGLYITAVDVAVLRIGCETINPKYLVYLLNSPWFKDQVKQYESGTTRKRISRKNLDRIEMTFPSLPEQERIVARIEELFSQLDAGVETLKKAKAQLAVYRQAVLKEAFESVIPESTTCNVEDVCKDIKVGIVIKPAQYYTSADIGVRAFRSANVREFAVNDSDWVYLTKAGHEANLRSEIHTGDVLVVRSGYPGTACVVPPTYNGCNAIDILIAVPDVEKILPEYLCAYTNSPLGRKIVQEKKRGVAQAHFNVSGYSKTPIIVPCMEMQKRVVAEIDARLSECDSIEQTVDTALLQAEAMRQSILKDAFEGRL